jgi:hypothetical protein
MRTAAGAETAPCRAGYALLIVLAGALAYASSFGGAFVDQDDFGSILHNAHIRSLRNPWRAMALPPYLLGEGATAAGRPVLGLSLAINCALTGTAPRGFHWGNLLIHLCAGLCVFGVIRRTLWLPRAGGFADRAACRRAAAAALIWTLHPLNTQAVTYLVQRAESQAGLLYLLTVYCAIRAWDSAHARRWIAGALLACLLGMCTKQTVATAPLLVWAYDALLRTGSWRAAWQRRWRLYGSLAACWLPLGALHVWVLGADIAGDFASASPWRYAFMQPGVVLHYLRLAFWPHPLIFQHHWPPAPLPAALPALVVVGVAVVVCLWAAARVKAWSFAGVWFWLMLAPSSSFYPQRGYNAVCEYRMYLALAAVVAVGVLLVAWVLRHWLPRTLPRHLAGVALTGVVALALGWRTQRRNHDYHDMVTLYAASAAQQPAHWDLRRRIGDICMERGEPAAALAWYEQALAIAPDAAPVYASRGRALLALQRGHDALSNYLAASEHCPHTEQFHVEAGLAKQRVGDLTGAVALWEGVLAREPDHAIAHVLLSTAYAQLGDPARSERHACRANALAARALLKPKEAPHAGDR